MLENLILNRKFEAAKNYQQTSTDSFMDYLNRHFVKGNRQQFFSIFSLLRKQSKLEFYLRVYFFIYNIHPTTINHPQNTRKNKGIIPETQINAFKDFIDNQGAELAKTNQFLQFYALPYIKKPLQHQAFKNLFKKEWVNALKQKLVQYLQEEEKRIKKQCSKLSTNHKSSIINNSDQNQKIREMEKVNQQLFQQVKQFAQKCHILEESHQMMTEGFHSHMMQAQSKWFQITKQLVDCSKSLIGMLISESSQFLGDKKFLKIRKRTEKYQKFVNKKFQDLVSHSQDISIFDRPSINQLSCSVMPYTQKSNGPIIKDISTIMGIDQYIPTDYQTLLKHFKKGPIQKNNILNSLTYRIAKSKDKLVKRLHIASIFKADLLGFKSGQISQLLASHQTMRSTVKLILLISHDSFGKNILFINNNIHRDFIGLMHSCKDKTSLESIMSMLNVIASQKKFKHEIIDLDIIQACVGLLRKGKEDDNQAILENVAAILLNTIMLHEGLKKFEKQRDIFEILKKYIRLPFKLVKNFVYGIIFSLLQSEQLFKIANKQNFGDFIDKLPTLDPGINKQKIAFLKDNLTKFHPKKININIQQDEDSQEDEQDDYPIFNIQQYSKNHEELVQKYSLKNKQAKKQYNEMKQFYEEMKNIQSVPKFYQPQNQVQVVQYNSPKNNIYASRNQQQQTPYIKQLQSNNKNQADFQTNKDKKVNNFISPKEEVAPKRNRQFRIKDKDMNKLNFQKQKKGNDSCQQQRLRKSVSADRGIGRSHSKQDIHIYESNKMQRNRISQFRNIDDKGYRSPQTKKMPRKQILKQLNEQLQAGEIKRKKNITEYSNRKQQKYYTQVKQQAQDQAFQSRPKIRRSPPRQ